MDGHGYKNRDDLWRKRYPRITKKIDELEERIKHIEDNGKTKW